mgnify:CR=1 FL=1
MARRWRVSVGSGTVKDFDELRDAKRFAKGYFFADIYERIGEYSFLRFTVENNRLKRS